MSKTISILLLFASVFSASAADLITATITLTNLPSGPTDTITINGSTRTWTNSILSSPSTLIKETNAIPLSATNLLNHLSLYQAVAGQFTSQSNPTNVVIFGRPGQALTVTAAGGWADITLSTNNAVTNTYAVIMPITVEAPTNQTNIASLLVAALNLSTTALATNASAASNYVTQGANAGQVVASPLSLFSLTMARLRTNALVVFTNGSAWTYLATDTNGFPVLRYSDGTPLDPADQLGFINQDHILTLKGAAQVLPLLRTNELPGFGFTRNTWKVANTWTNADSVFENGFIATNARTYMAKITNSFNEGSTNSNQKFTGTNTWNGDISYGRFTYSSIINGNNTGIPIGTNVIVELSGGSTIAQYAGFVASRDGDERIVRMSGPVTNVIVDANDPVWSPDGTAARRITTGTGGALLLTNSPSWIRMIYRTSGATWEVIGNSR